MLKLSPSSINLFKDCPRCFWNHFNNKPRPAGIFPSLPSGMDKILKIHFDFFMEKQQLPPELKQLKDYKLFDNKELLELWRNNFKGIQYTHNNVLIRGAVDNILVKGTKLVVLDYKTRGFPLKEDTHEHYIDQLNIYNFLLRKNNYQTEDYAYLLFYHPNKVLENGDFTFHAELIKIPINTDEAEILINEAIECLSKDQPESDIDCEFCKYIL